MFIRILNANCAFFPVENERPQKLSRQQIISFNDRGFIFPLDVFSQN
jgi:hypothetical protein